MMTPSVLLAALALTSPIEPSPGKTCAVAGVLTVKDKLGKPFTPEYAEVYVDTALVVTPRKQPRRMEQKGLAFVPRILVVEKGDVVVFANTETNNTPHEIHANKDKNTFVSGENSNPETFQKTFEHVGETHLGCNKHAFMSGTILTVPNSLHVRVESNGKWTISGAPARALKLVFWQQTATQRSQVSVPVSACDTNVKVNLETEQIARAEADDNFETYIAND